MADVLLARPSYDQTTSTLHQWADEVLSAARASASHRYRDLSTAQATRTNAETHLQQPTDCFVFYGHGEHDRLIAQAGPPMVDRTNDHLLADKLVYVVACDSATTLGPDASRNGARTFMGYDDLVGIVLGGPELWFRRGANAAINFLLAPPADVAAPSCDLALDYARTAYGAGVHYYSRGGGVGHYNDALAAAWLRWNRDSLVLLGDRSAGL